MGISSEIVVYSSLSFKKYRWVSYVTIGQLGFIVVNLFVMPTPKLEAEREAKKIAIDQGLQSSSIEFMGGELYQNNITIHKLGNLNYREIFSFSNFASNILGRPYFTGGLILASSLLTFGLFYRARRAIHMITLLPKDKVRISTFSPIALGKPPTIEIPLSHVSCLETRDPKKNYCMLKIKYHRGNYLIDQSNGKYDEPELFDKYLGYARSWAAR